MRRLTLGKILSESSGNLTIEVIKRFSRSNVLIYADPPYLLGVRTGKQYRKEMKDKDHIELLEALRAHRGKVLIGGYDSELYRNMLQGWYREENYCYTQSGRRRKDVLWMNFELEGQQMRLPI